MTQKCRQYLNMNEMYIVYTPSLRVKGLEKMAGPTTTTICRDEKDFRIF